MRAILAAACISVLAGCAERPIAVERGSFDWLAGCWRVERDNGVYEEMWLPARPDGTIGAAREVRAGKMVSHEFSQIEVRGDTLVYIARPARQAPAEFTLKNHEPGRLVFENAEHDFPQRVEYRYVDLNAIHARIEGKYQGKDHAVEYPMRRIECDGG